jgi:hypothetical protein
MRFNLASFKIISKKAIVATMLAAISSSAAVAGNFLFRIDGLTPDSSTLCDDVAYSEGQRLKTFLANTLGLQIDVTDARCVDNGSHGPLARWDVEISYTAEKQLPIVSTYEVFSYFRPQFKTKEACIATIDSEKEIFTRQTKLDIFSAYCVIPSYSSDSWEINVTSFGNPERRPYAVSSNVFGTILGHTRETFTDMMSREFAKFGFEVAQLTVENALSHQNLAVRYYGDQTIRLEEMTISEFQNPTDCTQLVEDTQRILNDSDLRSFGVYCAKDPLARTGAALVSMSQTPSQMLIIKPETVYESIEACATAKPAVVDHYISDLKRDIKTGYCSFNGSSKKFSIVMIEKKRS